MYGVLLKWKLTINKNKGGVKTPLKQNKYYDNKRNQH